MGPWFMSFFPLNYLELSCFETSNSALFALSVLLKLALAFH